MDFSFDLISVQTLYHFVLIQGEFGPVENPGDSGDVICGVVDYLTELLYSNFDAITSKDSVGGGGTDTPEATDRPFHLCGLSSVVAGVSGADGAGDITFGPVGVGVRGGTEAEDGAVDITFGTFGDAAGNGDGADDGAVDIKFGTFGDAAEDRTVPAWLSLMGYMRLLAWWKRFVSSEPSGTSGRCQGRRRRCVW